MDTKQAEASRLYQGYRIDLTVPREAFEHRYLNDPPLPYPLHRRPPHSLYQAQYHLLR